MNLGSRLKHILDERGLTVTQFSKEAGVPAQTIYALINRDSNKADMDILIKLLAALNMDFFTFMGEKKVVEKAAAKEVPASTPDGKTALYINSDTYEKILELAADEGITDEAVLAQVIEEYMDLGFGYRQRPLRSILRDMKPRSGRSGDMDSFLL
ncbi:MAG: helix-turn-helix transcriptional regulator [Eubacterium sp.]|nr:helix-turn-helix transcriptional regulator [Eubacterium sp.]